MAVDDAELHYHRGLAALSAHKPVEAVGHFQAAIAYDKGSTAANPRMRYLSYLGLAMSLAYRSNRQAVQACERAAALDPLDPVLQLNLGKVHLRASRREKAIQAFASGLRLAPGHRQLRQAMAGVDRRRRPPLSFLHRDHLLNRSLGRLRASFFPQRG